MEGQIGREEELLSAAYETAKYWWAKHGRRKPIDDYYSAANEATAWALSRYESHHNTKLSSWLKTILNHRLREVPGRKFRSGDLWIHDTRLRKGDREVDESIKISVLKHQDWLEALHCKMDLQRAVKTLSNRQQFVLTAILGGLQQKEIAEILGVDESRVSQIKSGIIKDLRDFLGE
jgi:RNA polymerase sigma factor (sigma-70 family)